MQLRLKERYRHFVAHRLPVDFMRMQTAEQVLAKAQPSEFPTEREAELARHAFGSYSSRAAADKLLAPDESAPLTLKATEVLLRRITGPNDKRFLLSELPYTIMYLTSLSAIAMDVLLHPISVPPDEQVNLAAYLNISDATKVLLSGRLSELVENLLAVNSFDYFKHISSEEAYVYLRDWQPKSTDVVEMLARRIDCPAQAADLLRNGHVSSHEGKEMLKKVAGTATLADVLAALKGIGEVLGEISRKLNK